MNRPTSARRPRGGAGAATGWERAGRGHAARERRRIADDPDRADPPPTRLSDHERQVAEGRPAKGRARRGHPGAERVGAVADPPPPDGAGGGKPRRLRLARLRRASRTSARPVSARYRRRRIVAALAAALVLLVGVGLGTWVLLHDAGFANVEDVTVTGLSTVPEQAVRDAVAVTPGGPLIAVDTAGIARRVAALEGVASVQVRRAWPHTIEVEVTERVPVALWQTPQGLFEVDGTGLSYRRAPQPPPALPRLTFDGVGPQDPSTAAAIAVLHDLTEPLRTQVATVEVAGTKVTLGLGDGRSVRWGGPERSADKIAVLGPLLGQPGTVYDVSSPDLPTVRP